MTRFHDFVRFIDGLEDQVILLAGKRSVDQKDEEQLEALGELLCKWLPDCRFRSGNANGADEFFIRGVCRVDPECVELVLPYREHGKSRKKDLYSLAIDDLDFAAEPEVIYQTRDMAGEKLIDDYLAGIRNRFTIRASYLIRDHIMVIGSGMHGLKKASFAIFYDDLQQPGKGGTGYTMRCCDRNQVPYLDQRTWMNWLEEARQ